MGDWWTAFISSITEASLAALHAQDATVPSRAGAPQTLGHKTRKFLRVKLPRADLGTPQKRAHVAAQDGVRMVPLIVIRARAARAAVKRGECEVSGDKI